MKKWIDISPDEHLTKFVCLDNITVIEYRIDPDGAHCITVHFDNNNQFIYSRIKEKLFKKFNEIAEAIGLSHRLGEEKESAISVFRQAEEEKKKKKITVAEI